MVDLVLMVDFLDLVVIVNVVHMVDLVVMVVKGGVQISSPAHLETLAKGVETLVLKFCFFLLVVSIPCLKMVGMPMFNLQEIDVHANNSTLHIIIGILLSP